MTPRPGPVHPAARDDGVYALELMGYLPYVLLIGLMALQLASIGGAVTAAEAAARAGSRQAGTGGDAEAAALDALDPGLRGRASVARDGETVTVSLDVPVVIPFVDLDLLTVRRDATLPSTGPRLAGPGPTGAGG